MLCNRVFAQRWRAQMVGHEKMLLQALSGFQLTTNTGAGSLEHEANNVQGLLSTGSANGQQHAHLQ